MLDVIIKKLLLCTCLMGVFTLKAQHPFTSVESLYAMMNMDKIAYADSLMVKNLIHDTASEKTEAGEIIYFHNDRIKKINDQVIRIDDPTATKTDPSITLSTSDKKYFKALLKELELNGSNLLKKKRHLYIYKNNDYYITFKLKGSKYSINVSRHPGNV